MDPNHLSDEVLFRLKNPRLKSDDTFVFCKGDRANKPSVEQLSGSGKIVAIQLSYAHCEEQDHGISRIARAFKADSNGIITRLPRSKKFSFDEKHGFGILKFGRTSVDNSMFNTAMETGISGYWDDSTLIMVSSPEYTSLLKGTFDFVKPYAVQFTFKKTRNDPDKKNLRILKV